MNIAIFTPSLNPYSETFIQAHKNYLQGEVFYYYGPRGRIQLEGRDALVSKIKNWQYRIQTKLYKHPTSYINTQSISASLKQQAIDVILVEYGTHAFNLLDLLRECELPIVVHFHGYDASVKQVIEKCNHYKEVFAKATSVIAVSRKMQQLLLDLGCPSEKLVYNVYGPQPEFETVIPTYSKKQFIGIGRFTDKKAPYYTIMAFNQIIANHPDARLLLAGDGALLNMCQNLVKHFGFEEQVIFLGIVSPEAYRELLTESLAFVQHSITANNGDMEGTPLAVLEASVAGLPVISTNHAGIPDVIEHGKTGLLSEEHDVDAMAENMLHLLGDVDLAKKLGAAGKARILEHYSMQRHINVLGDVLSSAAGDSFLHPE
ncbi:glycosyltransferase involved in cell wall biosynthesis [Gelidibacter sediminis]|uniref:Glycosyltransferase involved in cell wall biosynthesis n=1 Tax=Gelidibacter sediminis TaxID=1608710 RepID=A0A4R7PJ37_9FLAO|nr:glycosyltransferase [Gelidibacter sediminis]TDU34405.1 glycosyltransferase involved in cell wall biosynthesis [Gelidibacter sediminis]